MPRPSRLRATFFVCQIFKLHHYPFAPFAISRTDNAADSANIQTLPLLRGLMSNEKLFEEMELHLKRELTPDERRFLTLANSVLKRNDLREIKEATVAHEAKRLAS